MDRNTQERFALNPVNIDIQRSRFDATPEVKTTFNLGDIIPLGMPIEILPGDTIQIDTSMAIRMQPLVSCPYDNIHFDLYYFFVPNRLVWQHWREFMGENSLSPWIPTVTYVEPQLTFNGGVAPKSIGDYMGLPVGLSSGKYIHVFALPFRGFVQIYNDWFRDENLCQFLNLSIDDTDRTGMISTSTNYSNPIISAELGGHLFKAAKTRDYFTSALPGPQKGSDVMVFDHLPVYFDTARRNVDVVNDHGLTTNIMIRKDPNDQQYHDTAVGQVNNTSGSGVQGYAAVDSKWQPANWYVDGSLSINQLRLAFQVQKLYERDARGGSRYIEQLKSHFGVTAPDASLQRSQYLGGSRVSINLNQILQTSETGSTPQGNVAGYSLTSDYEENHVVQSFTEHGRLFAIGVARIDQHTYQQGIHRSWTRRNRLDYYYPVLANIGEQPILNRELFAAGIASTSDNDTISEVDNQVFGYQEAWAEYRYMPSIVTGEMRSNVTNSLDSWHFADDYATRPSLSQSWIEEDLSNVDRALAVQSSVADQFFGDFRFHITMTRPMPLYSIPGLIDHN